METINTTATSTTTTTNNKPLVKDAAELMQELNIDDGKTNENFIDIIDGNFCLTLSINLTLFDL
jgi:hypothetical protein